MKYDGVVDSLFWSNRLMNLKSQSYDLDNFVVWIVD